jgi:ABC-type nickel/cobalt efflux system permease component RcnA
MRWFSAACLAALLLLVPTVDGFAQNPLFRTPSGGGDDSVEAEQERAEESRSPQASTGPQLFGRPAAALIRRWSNNLQRSIASLSRQVREEGNWGAGLLAFGVAVLFGMVHIAGPGHGKIFALSYFSSRESKPRAGLIYSAVVNTVDSVSAFIVVVLGYLLLQAIAPAFRLAAPRILSIVSYSLIIIFGVAHLVSHLKPHSHDHGGEGEESPDHDHQHDHAHHSAGAELIRDAVEKSGHDPRNPWVLAVTVGLIPCPVSTVLLVYGVVNDVLPFMMFMVVGVTVGGFTAMSVIALFVIAGRARLMELVSHGTGAKVATVLEFASSGLIIAAGVLLLLAALG